MNESNEQKIAFGKSALCAALSKAISNKQFKNLLITENLLLI